jgi:preprotein translocase subunit YajC
MTTKQVNELTVGEKVKMSAGAIVYVRSIETNRVRVSKRPTGLCILSIPFYAHSHMSPMNRVEVVA